MFADFIDLNKQMSMSMEPPRPRVLPIRRTHPDFKRFVDWKRVSYLRTLQHEAISRCGREVWRQGVVSSADKSVFVWTVVTEYDPTHT